METNQQSAKISTTEKKIVILVVVAVTAAVFASAFSITMLSSNHNASQGTSPAINSWIVKGAYATYEGQTNVLGISISFNAKMEIVDLNATQVEVQTAFNMSSPFGNQDNTTTTWVNRSNMTYQPEGLALNSTYQTQVTIPSLGSISCTAYVYNSQGISATYYVGNQIQWPVEMTMTSPMNGGQTYSIDIKLVNTNIKGL
ncbi:MAG TPA: hypothetical protein VK536_04385 [Candidatus Limnocylindrales bacterium]|nr:hypothetical protein [Candidatus Limnocylindrales bacterium]